MSFDAVAAANQLREAMKGWGTNEAALTQVVAHLRPADIAPLRRAYTDHIHRDLLKDIKDETGGNFEDALVAALTPLIEYDASLLRHAMKGLGTDEDILLEVLCTRSPEEIKAIENEFKNQYAHDLESDVRDEVSGDIKKLLVQRLKHDDANGDLARDAEHLYEAGQGKLGTDEAVFINILAHRSRNYIDKLNTTYANKYGKSLHAVVESECGGDFKRALLALVTPGPQYFADKIHHAMKGAGTEDKVVIRIVCSQRGRWLPAIAAAYLAKYNESLKKRISDECSGDYKKLLVGIIEHEVEGKQF